MSHAVTLHSAPVGKLGRNFFSSTSVRITGLVERATPAMVELPVPDLTPALDRFKAVLATLPEQGTELGALDELRGEIVQFAELRARANRSLLD